MPGKAKKEETITVMEIQQGAVKLAVLGRTPIILRRMSVKVELDLLFPQPRANAAARAAKLKHDVYAEFAASPHTLDDDNAPTYLALQSTSFKKALMGAAVDVPGLARAKIGRMTYVCGDRIPIYGIPQMMMSVVRMADINHTPDVNTRVIVPEWAAVVEVEFVRPLLNEQSICNLMAAAGVLQGVGDWRPEKGSGNYGQFRICGVDDPDFQRVVKAGGRAAQIAAMAKPDCYNDETRTLLAGYEERLANWQAGRGNGASEEPEAVAEAEEAAEQAVAQA
jgi:hypothetical protein